MIWTFHNIVRFLRYSERRTVLSILRWVFLCTPEAIILRYIFFRVFAGGLWYRSRAFSLILARSSGVFFIYFDLNTFGEEGS